MEQNVSIYYIVETYANNMEWCIELRARDSQKDQDLVQKEPRSLSGSCNCVLTRFSEADRHQPVDGNAHTHTHGSSSVGLSHRIRVVFVRYEAVKAPLRRSASFRVRDVPMVTPLQHMHTCKRLDSLVLQLG